MRLLFSSIHCYLDPSSGAALCTRELLELLATRGIDCRAFTTGVLDYERETPLDQVLGGLDVPPQRFEAELSRRGRAEVIDPNANGVRVTFSSSPRTPREGKRSRKKSAQRRRFGTNSRCMSLLTP
jgi:hypothetical protein